MSPGRTVKRQDQIVITCKTTSTGHYLTRGAFLCSLSKHQFLHPQRGGRATLHCPDSGFRALSLGRMPVALGNHESSGNGSRDPRRRSASRSSRTAPLLTTARLYLSTSTRPSLQLPSRLEPLLPASAAEPFPGATSATRATPGNAHAQ